MRRQFDGTYLFTDRPYLFGFGMLILAFNFAVGTWNHYHVAGIDWKTVLLALGVGASIAGTLALPGTRLTFDPMRKTISWSMRSFLRRSGGRVPFENVQQVIVQSAVLDSGRTFYRVAICTPETNLPLGVEFSPDIANVEKLAASIRDLLGLPAPEQTEGALQKRNISKDSTKAVPD